MNAIVENFDVAVVFQNPMSNENVQFWTQWIRLIPITRSRFVWEPTLMLLPIENYDLRTPAVTKLNFLNFEMGQSFPVHFLLRLNCIVSSFAGHFEVCQSSGCAQIGGDFHVDFRRQWKNWRRPEWGFGYQEIWGKIALSKIQKFN